MGSMNDAKIEAWQKHSGIKPARGEQDEALRVISKLAYTLIRIIELERSGIRDGDGNWYGCDPLDDTIRELTVRWDERKERLKQWRTDNVQLLKEADDLGIPF